MRIFLLFALAILFLSSCRVQRNEDLNYLQNATDTSGLLAAVAPELKIQKYDILTIRVYSMSIDPRTDQPYNMDIPGGSPTTTGYLVDGKGNIQYPRIGIVKAEGLTKEELAENLRVALREQLKEPTVMVRFANFRITVLGDVGDPGTYDIATEKVTILEAMGLAGDIAGSGKKTNIKVVREVGGRREIGFIDLTSKDLFNSPYYHLQQNDVVVVETSGRTIRQAEQQSLAQQIGLATSIITTIALILNFIK